MRQYVKKQIKELLITLRSVHAYIEKAGTDERNAILTQCQEGAIKAGGIIEQSEGDDCQAVHVLEKYCEDLFDIAQDTGDIYSLRTKCRAVSEDINEAINETDKLPEKKVALFLPYKASMWDSLESVWIAARDDPDCEAYVIPVPYFDRNEDRSFGQIHYEGKEFPDYVPIENWETADIENTHPELIFIHNPYDDGNFVTSVHPRFYARELHKYTDCLVYIPYFISNGDIPEHLCFTSGTVYADKVIVKDEKEKQIYIETFRKYEQEHDCKGLLGNYEDKFLPLGNPKLDRVISIGRSKVDIPETWKKIIFRTDGSRRKVIFFNNSIGTFLNNTDKYLDKIEDTFKTFRNRDDAVLLWRPHPLLPATIRSMVPEALPKYTELVENYKSEGWGIYDDTSDMDKSIAISDAYFGDDSSSVLTVYKATGKPVMVWNLDVKNAEE